MGYKSTEKTKVKHRKGLWSPEEDLKLKNYVLKHGHGCWSSVPINAGLHRNGKSCRLRWINYLRPGLKRGMFSPQEEETILGLHHLLGNKWSQIAQSLPGRTDNEIKNYWHSYLKKRIAKAEESEAQTKTQCTTTTTSSENTEHSTLSSQNLTTDQIPSFEFFHSTEKLSINPKLFFAEWLSMDQEVADSVKPMASSDGLISSHGSSSSFQDPGFMNDFLDGGFGSDIHDGLNNASVNDMFSSEFKFETQVSGNHHHQFVGSMSGNDVVDICSDDYHINNDVMFIL